MANAYILSIRSRSRSISSISGTDAEGRRRNNNDMMGLLDVDHDDNAVPALASLVLELLLPRRGVGFHTSSSMTGCLLLL